jgi:hypothetical protein
LIQETVLLIVFRRANCPGEPQVGQLHEEVEREYYHIINEFLLYELKNVPETNENGNK